jgi:hypothetical protein
MDTEKSGSNGETHPVTPDGFNLFMGDRLAEYIINRLHWSPAKTGIIATLFMLVSSAILAIINGRFLPSPDYIAFTQDATFLITEIFTNSVIWGYYIWTCTAPFKVLSQLGDSGIIKMDEDGSTGRLAFLKDKRWPLVAFVLSVVVGFAYLGGNIEWLSTRTTYAIRVVIAVIPGAYATILTILRLIFAARVFKIYMKNISLHPLHPDNVGGLRPLADFSLQITWMIVVFGIMGAFLEISDILRHREAAGYFVHGSFLTYLIAAPIVFFYPLSIAHQAMRNSKENFLLDVSHQFNDIIAITHQVVKANESKLEENLKKIEQLKSLHQVGLAFPVWPFDVATLRRFSLSVSSPIVAFLSPFIVKFVIIPILEPMLPSDWFETLKNILQNF